MINLSQMFSQNVAACKTEADVFDVSNIVRYHLAISHLVSYD